MLMRGWISGFWPWALAAMFCAGIIHITTVFGVPYLASRDAWSRLEAFSSPNQLYILPIAATDTPLPFMAPDIAYAFCRFDLTTSNVTLQTELGDASWSIAVSGRQGDNFYFISGAEAKRRQLRLLLVPRARLSSEASTERSEEGDEQIIVITPTMTGVAIVRAPVRGPSFADDTINALQSAQCQPVIESDPNVVASEIETKPEPAPAIIRGGAGSGTGVRRPVRPPQTQIR
jgi:uncharacterized membrane protein